MGVATALLPTKPGDRIKTDRRDARKLAELLRAGLLTPVRATTLEQEAARDLCRAREAAKGDEKRVKHRLSKFMLRRRLRWTLGRKMWTRAHLEWLRGRRLAHAPARRRHTPVMLMLNHCRGLGNIVQMRCK